MKAKLYAGFCLAGLLVILVLGWWGLKSEPESTVIETITVPQEEVVSTSTVAVVGQSVEGRAIEAHTFGQGETKLLFVGGVHGGYEWNSVLLAYEMIDYLHANPVVMPEQLQVSIIPNLNPDGVFAVTGKEGRFNNFDVVSDKNVLADARFNANQVDLNRNFDCKWAPESSWRGQTVSAGSQAFSEPETLALKLYVEEFQPEAVVFWHSQANTVYASECEAGVLPETLVLMDTYAAAANYKTQASFDAYPITGDAEGWLASIGIPAITVEFETHESMDWNRNLNGTLALFNYYQQKLAR